MPETLGTYRPTTDHCCFLRITGYADETNSQTNYVQFRQLKNHNLTTPPTPSHCTAQGYKTTIDPCWEAWNSSDILRSN